MSGAALRQALGRAARALGCRSHSSAAGLVVQGSEALGLPLDDHIMRPYYEKLAKLQVIPAAHPKQSSPSELEGELALFRMHNVSLPCGVMEGHMIKAKVLEVGRRTVTLDTGLRPARVARSDLPQECIIGTTMPDAAPRKPGELREGDIVQVCLESVDTLEGDMLVSGVQASTARRMVAVWNELEERQRRGELVKGRILNSVGHGYAVGVAGVVAFLSAKQCSRPTARRVGQLQKFRILNVDRTRPALLLADPTLAHGGGGRYGGGGNAPRRPPRNVQEAQRRQELARVAEELRSVLALRGPGPASSSGSGVAAAPGSSPNGSAR